jgi:hypothetical protein
MKPNKRIIKRIGREIDKTAKHQGFAAFNRASFIFPAQGSAREIGLVLFGLPVS